MRKWIKAAGERFDFYDFLAAAFFVFLLVLILVNLSMYPVYLDIPYHMAVTRGFREAGGITTWDFWDYAPAGRVHLYPPLLHVGMSLALDLGISMQTTATLVCLLMFPLILLALWWSMRKLFGTRAAFYSVVLASVPYAFFWQSGVTVAASLVMVLTPLLFLALEKDRAVASVILLTLCLYSHLVMGHLAALALFVYLLHRWKDRRMIIGVIAFSYLLYLPWGVHVLLHLSDISVSGSGTGGGFAFHLLLWIPASAGFVLCYLRRRHYYLLSSYLLSMVPIAFFYPHRFWEGHVFLPLAMLGGVALDRLHARLQRLFSDAGFRGLGLKAAGGVTALLLLLIFFCDPVVAAADRGGKGLPAPPPLRPGGDLPRPAPRGPRLPGGGKPPGPPVGAEGERAMSPRGGGGIGLSFQPTTVLILLGWEEPRMGAGSEVETFGGENLCLAEVVEENSAAGEVVFVPDGRLGDLVYALTGRYATKGMFHEVGPEEGEPPPGEARMAVLPLSMAFSTRPASERDVEDLLAGAAGGDWEAVARTEHYVVLVNEGEVEEGETAAAALPLWAAYLLLLLAVGVIFLDLARKGRCPSAGGPSLGEGGVPAPRSDRDGGKGDGTGFEAVLAVVPAYNEEKGIAGVVRDIRRSCPGIEVLVVDDGSEDGTGKAALQAGALVARRENNGGVGEAVRYGLEYARRMGYRYVVRLDGDGQHPARYLGRLLEPLYRGEAEVVVGSRFLEESRGTAGTSVLRRMGIRYFCFLLKRMTGRKFTDPTSGFRAYSRSAARFLLSLPRRERYPEVFDLWRLALEGYRIVEVPVKMRPRVTGKSSLGAPEAFSMVLTTTVGLCLGRSLAHSGSTAHPSGYFTAC